MSLRRNGGWDHAGRLHNVSRRRDADVDSDRSHPELTAWLSEIVAHDAEQQFITSDWSELRLENYPTFLSRRSDVLSEEPNFVPK